MILGAAVVAFVVALLAMGVGSSNDTQNTSATGQQTADTSRGGECGDGQPDPTYTVNVTSDPNPPRPEGTTFHLAVRHNGDPVTGAKVCMSADMPDMQHPGLTKAAKESSAGVYDAADIKFSMGGAWAASVTILEPGKAPVLLTTAFQVAE
jgi:YtkA-like